MSEKDNNFSFKKKLNKNNSSLQLTKINLIVKEEDKKENKILKEENSKLKEELKKNCNIISTLQKINYKLTNELEKCSKYLNETIEKKIYNNKNNINSNPNNVNANKNNENMLLEMKLNNANKQIDILIRDNTNLKKKIEYFESIQDENARDVLIGDNKNLQEENNNLKNEINILKKESNTITKLSKQVDSLKNTIIYKENEKYELKVKIEELKKKINLLNFSNKTTTSLKKQLNSINKKEKKMQKYGSEKKIISHDKISIIFLVEGEEFEIECSEKDNFFLVEDKLYEICPKYRETDNYFIVDAKKILRFKTIEENKIKNKHKIILAQYIF